MLGPLTRPQAAEIRSGTASDRASQTASMIASAVGSAERYYPAIQLNIWGGQTPAEAMQVAIAEAYGRA